MNLPLSPSNQYDLAETLELAILQRCSMGIEETTVPIVDINEDEVNISIQVDGDIVKTFGTDEHHRIPLFELVDMAVHYIVSECPRALDQDPYIDGECVQSKQELEAHNRFVKEFPDGYKLLTTRHTHCGHQEATSTMICTAIFSDSGVITGHSNADSVMESYTKTADKAMKFLVEQEAKEQDAINV